MKSPPSRAFAAPHVHPRPRKRPPRCTLDCGFKAPESPALRGFEGGPRALATAALYLVLKSNGYNHQENLLKKFNFSLKNTSANIVKKVIRTLTPQIVFSTLSTSPTNGPRSLSFPKAGTHSPFGERSHTTAHTAKQGPSLPRPQRGLVLPAISLLFHHAFIYIHFPVLCEPSTPAEENNPAKLPP